MIELYKVIQENKDELIMNRLMGFHGNSVPHHDPRALGEAGECGAKRGAAPEPRLGKFGAGGSSDVTCASAFPFSHGLGNNNLRHQNNISSIKYHGSSSGICRVSRPPRQTNPFLRGHLRKRLTHSRMIASDRAAGSQIVCFSSTR
jgi:hypothetical protein